MAQDHVLSGLMKGLSPPVRRSVEDRFSAMGREFRYLSDSRSPDLSYLQSKGWSEDRFTVLFMLNSVYQQCIGPLHSSGRSNAGIGSSIPILHGTNVFDKAHSAHVNEMALSFFNMVEQLGYSRSWLSKNTCGDVIYWIARNLREIEGMGGDQG